MKEIILFDLDYTLLNTGKFKENFKIRISNLLKISLDEFIQAEKGYVKAKKGFTDFIPEDYIRYISNYFNHDQSEISKAFFDENNFQDALFGDVIPTLDALKSSYRIGVFSEGFKDFKILKLHKTGILKYFDKDLIFIFKRKLIEDSLKLLPDNCFIVDDNLPVICALKELKRVRPIWLNRETNENNEDCLTIHSLENLNDVLDEYRSN